jgi:hypothetical protein
MGFVSGRIFGNDHNLDVLSDLLHDLRRRIEEGVSGEEEAGGGPDKECDANNSFYLGNRVH